MDILLATTNPHKLDELRTVINEPSIRFLLLSDVEGPGRISEPVEDQDSFEGNALLKARHYAAASGMLTLADDSGLEVDALAGQPGVRSARFAGVQGSRDEIDAANNLLLLKKLDKHPVDQRTARFVCALALYAPESSRVDLDQREPAAGEPETSESSACLNLNLSLPLIVRGTIEGRILARSEVADPGAPERGRGEYGFGYDPLFELPTEREDHPGLTTAELSPAQKNGISHRGQAARELWKHLEPALLQRT